MQQLLLISFIASCLQAGTALCQRTVPKQIGYFGTEKTIIKLDPLSNIPEKEFPFDRWFYIRRYYKATALPVMTIFVTNRISFPRTSSIFLPPVPIESVDFFDAVSDVITDQPSFTKATDILVPPLDPRSGYDLVFAYPMSFERRTKLADAFIDFHEGRGSIAQDTINAINVEKTSNLDYGKIDFRDFDLYYHLYVKSILDLGINFSTRASLIATLDKGGGKISTTGGTKQLFLDMEILSVSGTESFKLETRAGALIQPDFGAVFYGLGGSGDIGIHNQFFGVMPYVGFTIMARSFDADIPIRHLRGRIYPLQRLSFHAGVTLFSLAKDKYRQDLFNKNNLMLGLGYRLTSALKVQGGVILYRKQDPDPLYIKTQIAPIGYVGLSVDLRIKSILGDIGKFLFGS